MGVRILGVLAFAATLAQGVVAHAQSGWETGTDGLAPIPALSARVTDRTGTLQEAERAALESKLASYEGESGNQVVVLMVPSTKPEPIEAYSIRVAEAWKIGRKGADNGVLFLVAKDDRKMRMEVGYGLEGVLTDAVSRRIIAEDVAPRFRNNQFAAGIDAGVDRIIATLGKTATSAPVSPGNARRPAGGFDFQTLLILLFVGVPVLGGILKRIFGRFLGSTFGGGIIGVGAWLVLGSIALGAVAGLVGFMIMLFLGAGSSFGRRGGMYIPTGGWGGGGGFGGGGGGGGFSGGGGSFGGGGASGSW